MWLAAKIASWDSFLWGLRDTHVQPSRQKLRVLLVWISLCKGVPWTPSAFVNLMRRALLCMYSKFQHEDW